MTLSAAAVSVLAASLLSPAPQDIARGPLELTYTVAADDALGRDGVIPVRVEILVQNPPRPRAVFEIPVWAPGSYRLRDFPDRIRDVRASGGMTDVAWPVERLDRDTWQVRHGDSEAVRLSYTVELRDGDRFMLRGDQRRCITYEGPQVYMYLRGHQDAPCAVRFELPAGWAVGSGLVDRGGGRYFAQNYDFLADCPVKLGLFQTFSFTSHERPIDVVVDGPGDVEFDHETWVGNIKKIVDCQGEIFGGFPFDRYTFLYTASPGGGGGGLEHLTSTAIGVTANSLRRRADTGMGVTAHEFFHLWNVKRIRPRELGPFDYTRPVRTTSLWLMEGVTSYYTAVTLSRAGLEPAERFWSAMAREIQSFESAPARQHVSSAMASYTVWDSTASDRSLNYYNSGQVLGLLLDLEIRGRTRNQRSLDDFMRSLYRLCRNRGRGFEEHELPGLAGGVCGDPGSFDEWFDRYVYGTLVPPYEEILGRAGMIHEATRRAEKSLRGVATLGRDGVPYFVDPEPGAAQARRSGRLLKIGEVAVAGMDNVDQAVAAAAPGDLLRLEVETLGGRTRTVDAVVVENVQVRVTLSEDPDASELELAVRHGIVTGVPRRPGG